MAGKVSDKVHDCMLFRSFNLGVVFLPGELCGFISLLMAVQI